LKQEFDSHLYYPVQVLAEIKSVLTDPLSHSSLLRGVLKMKTKLTGVPRMPLAPACALFVASALVLSPALNAQQTSGAIEEIVVQGTATGTGLRGVAPVGSQTLSISREDLLESPVRGSAEIIASLPQGSQDGSGVASGDGGNTAGASGLNLRGLGTNASLQLLNGNRMAGQGISSIGADPNAIPFAAIERVEVVLDGASSVYGSDAVAGVVNFRMRNDFEGLDVQISGQSGHYDTGKVEIVGGTTWDNANLMVGFSKEYRTPMLGDADPRLLEDLSRYGADDGRDGNNPTSGPNGIIRAGNTNYGIPANWQANAVDTGYPNPAGGNLLRPSLADIQNTAPEYADSADTSYYRAANDRRSLFVSAGFDLADDLRLEYMGMATKRESRNLNTDQMRVTVTPDSPYYIPGLTGGNYTVYSNTNLNGFPWKSRNYDRTQNHYVDVIWDIGEFQAKGQVGWGDTKGCDICRPERNNAALRHDPAGTPVGYANYAEVGFDSQGNPRGGNPEWWNPYMQGGDGSAAEAWLDNNLIGYTYRAGNQSQNSVKFTLEGPLAELPGGTVRGSIGTEYIDQNHWLWLNQTVRYYDGADYVLRDTTYGREFGSIFGEVYVPLIGDSNAMPGVQRLAVNLSARRDEYSDFGDTTNPRIGLVWDVNDDLSMRASWGTSFRAPTVEQVNPGVNSVMSAVDVTVATGLPVAQTNAAEGTSVIFRRTGRTPTLAPETATNWSMGVEYSPYQIEGLDLAVTYYDVKYEDRIENLPNSAAAFTSLENFNRYRSFITIINQPATCVEGDTSTYAPAFLTFLNYPGTRYNGSGNDCSAVAELEAGLANVGSVFQNGLDAQASYTWANDYGTFRASTNIAKILELERQLSTGGDRFSVLDIRGWQNSFRMSARLAWGLDNWNAALSSTTVGEYTNEDDPTAAGDVTIDSWTTFDLTVGYTTPDDGTMLSGIGARLGITNLTDKEPPLVNTNNSVFDSDNHNVFGRMYQLELSKSF
jgi:iron complex outermembrane receptor protein